MEFSPEKQKCKQVENFDIIAWQLTQLRLFGNVI